MDEVSSHVRLNLPSVYNGKAAEYEITALFCDLRGFTGFTESTDAEDVMALLRDYHAAIGEIIIKYNGTLERYAGDGAPRRREEEVNM